MQQDIASVVHSVLTYGLRLKERLERGEPLDFDTEQSELKKRLLSEPEARRWAEFGGDRGESGRGEHFLGIRYALTCWLDEVFILDSPWGPQWNDRSLERALYDSRDRGYKFWEQAQRADIRPGTDASEVFFLCAMLGFRGEMRDRPLELQNWVNAVRARILRGQEQGCRLPAELEPPSDVPSRHGRQRMQRMVLLWGAALLLLLPVAVLLVAIQWWR
jgi:type VI secretion system protein ImpK